MYRRVLAALPGFMPAHANLSLVLGGAGGAALGRALALERAHPMLWFNRGNLFAEAGSYRRALVLDPGFAGAWLNYGVALHGGGALGAAACAAARARDLGAGAQALNNLANARRDQGHVAQALALYARALDLAPAYADAARNRMAARLYVEDDEAGAGAEARAFVLRHGGGGGAPLRGWATRADEPQRRLRVGLLSSDLGDHPVGRNLAGFVAHRERAAIELAVYDTGGRREPASLWFRSRVDLWREVAHLDDAAIAGVVRADAVDVLLVLAGRFDRNRPLVASYAPAPLQLALHDGGPSGMGHDGTIAAWITDRWLHPEGEASGGDRLERLPVFYNFLAPDIAAAAWQPGEGGVRLGSFSNPAKLSPACLAAWARILEALPQARLVLKYRGWYGDAAVRARIVASLPAARVDFIAAAEDAAAHLGRYGSIDLALDPFPFSGATTSFEALAQGVPVLTFAGRSAIARTTTAILGPLGLDELIATSAADYVARAVDLARRPERLRALRAEIPQRLAGSSLLDAPAYAAALTAAIRRLWEERRRR